MIFFFRASLEWRRSANAVHALHSSVVLTFDALLSGNRRLSCSCPEKPRLRLTSNSVPPSTNQPPPLPMRAGRSESQS